MQNGVPRATGRPKAVLVLSPRKREQLESLASSRALHAGRVRRARIILLSAPGKTNMQIARQMGLTNATFGKWRRRFLEQDVSSLHAQKPSLAIRRDNQLVFRRPGSRKNERQTDGYGQNPNNHDEGYCGWEMALPSRVEPGHLESDKSQDER